MAFVKTPSTWFASWSEDATDITVPIASFPQLTAAEADGSTGDIRAIVHAILERLWAKWNSLAAADRPTQMTINKSASTNVATGITTNQYTIRIMVVATGEEVVAEPT